MQEGEDIVRPWLSDPEIPGRPPEIDPVLWLEWCAHPERAEPRYRHVVERALRAHKGLGHEIARRQIQRDVLDVAPWRTDVAFLGDAPPIDWLVEHVIPLSTVGLLTGAGGTSKSLLLLHLALLVAARQQGRKWLGHRILASGSSLMLTAEDGRDSLHRRICVVDPDGTLRGSGRCYVVPLVSAAPDWTLFVFDQATKNAVVSERAMEMLEVELDKIQDCRLLVLDPLQLIAPVDFTSDPAVAQTICRALARLAEDRKMTVIVAHHMRKFSGAIETPAEAREAIRGTSALVDGVRWAIAVWQADDDLAQRVRADHGLAPDQDVLRAALVKSNEPGDRTIRTLVRTRTGAIEDVTDLDPRDPLSPRVLAELVRAIAEAARDGLPYAAAARSQASVWGRRHELPASCRSLDQRTLELAVERLLALGSIVKARRGSWWLDVPDGPIARGTGELRHGARRE